MSNSDKIIDAECAINKIIVELQNDLGLSLDGLCPSFHQGEKLTFTGVEISLKA